VTTSVTLEDGRILGATNGAFDTLMALVAAELERRPGALPGLSEWLLNQRCVVQGPGVGYLDMRDLSPTAVHEFKAAFASGLDKTPPSEIPDPLRATFELLLRMWESIQRGEPPEALTSDHWKMAPWNGERRGPGWQTT